MGMPHHLTYFLRNLRAVKRQQWTGSKLGEKDKTVYISPFLFNLYAAYFVWNTGLDESQDGIKIARGNINNLRYADDTTLMTGSEEELKSILMRVKGESENAGLKFSIQKIKIMASGPIISCK